MTSATSSLSRSFTGDLELSDAPVAVSVVFADGSVRLILAGDTIGTWPTSDVRFVPVETGYELHAEGDSLPFVPHDGGAFAAFLEGRLDTPEPEVRGETPTADDAATPPFQDEEPLPAAQPPLFDLEPTLPPNGFEPDFALFEEEPESALAVGEEPDEYFAAGLNGPSTDPLPTFRSPLTNSPQAPSPPTQPEAPERPAAFGEREPSPEPDPVQSPGEPDPPARQVGTPAADGSPPEPESSVSDAAPDAAEDGTGASVAGQAQAPVFDIPAPPVAAVEEQPESDIGEGAAGGQDGLRKRLTRLRQKVTDRATSAPAGESDRPTEEDEDDTPQPIDDAENLRQWGLVAAGGLVIVAVVVMVIWGLASVLGGDEPVEEATDNTVAAEQQPVVSAPPSTAPPTVPVTASAEEQAAAAEFVSSWNALAAQYAYGLSIADADSLPISTAPAPTVHLTYAEDGVLRMNMAPKGNGNDRDILVAMGLAVAWADSSLSPEGRKEVLGALGVDVDDPNLNDMGGELNRGGVLYRASVADGILSFEVDPAG